jgi:alpha-amylase/alpha-mannosidase (GH57 family)
MALRVAFLWHMHQPCYLDTVNGAALMPWVRLHATKGYLDMIWLVEQVPEFRCTFNLTPVLVRQIQQLANGKVRDLWHELAATPAEALTAAQKADLLEHFFKANSENMIKPYPRYCGLLQKRGGGKVARAELERIAGEISVPEYRDLQVWFNLTWFGYAAESLYPEIGELKRKGRDFTEADKQVVFDRQRDILQMVLNRYRNAADRGQIEISTTPFYHPILPLVYNTDFARRCMPGRELPPTFAHPEDARAQLARARDFHAEVFGQAPHGLWPSEGSVCPELIPLLQELGFEWFATDEEVLWRSLAAGSSGKPHDRNLLFQGYRAEFGKAAVNVVFRDRNLSDFIGFTACRNEPVRAAEFLMDHLREIARSNAHAADPLCAIILDGENAWENFADGGQRFLTELYRRLTQDKKFVATTFHDCFSGAASVVALDTLHTGSWINADFDIWIGSSEENRAWELLGQTRDFLQSKADRHEIKSDQHDKALEEIYAAEGSDWFWWYGDDFVTDNNALFDEAFRSHLENVYRILAAPVPDALNIPIGDTQPRGVLREPADLIQPQIDGEVTSYYEWVGAGIYEPFRAMTTMYQGEQLVKAVYFGFDATTFYLRIDFRPAADISAATSLAVDFLQPHPISFIVRDLTAQDTSCEILDESRQCVQQGGATEAVRFAFKTILELAIPLSTLRSRPDDTGAFCISLTHGKIQLERHPAAGTITVAIPGLQFHLKSWLTH